MKKVIKNQKIIMKFLKKLGLDEKTKFLLETSGDNLIDLDQEVVEEIIPSN